MFAKPFATALLLLLAPHAPGEQKAAPNPASPSDIPAAVWTQMDNVAHQLAKGGRERECKEICDVLADLGMPKAQLTKLQTGCLGELHKATHAVDSLPDAAKRLKQVARQIAGLVEQSPAAEKEKVLRLVLRLDDSVDEAHKALGDELVGKTWMSPEQKLTRKRRGEILEAVEKAAALEPEVESGASDDALLAELNGGPGSFARYGGWVLQSSLTEERTKRVLIEVIRARALSAWLRGRDLALPKKPGAMGGLWFYLLDQDQKYYKAVDRAQKADNLTAEEATRFRESGGFHDSQNLTYYRGAFESHLETQIFCYLSTFQEPKNTASVVAGHLNWVSLALFGVSMPQYTWKNQPPVAQSQTHVDNPADRKLREEKYQLAKAGILGCRSWMGFLAERNEDPRWENSLVDQLGMVVGEDLLKATTVVEFMQELGILKDVLTKLPAGKDGEKPYAAMERSLGVPVTQFEARWRAWIVPDKTGLAQALEKTANTNFPPDALAALAHLNDVRKKCFAGRVKVDNELKLEREICDGAQKHAEYLVQNPEQADKWPDAHEEYRDKPGYTPEGHWSGNHSNVVSGESDPKESVDGWIGTFYHRLPMLTPELARVGWGQAGNIAVLDVGSFIPPPESDWIVAFPYDGMTNVPVHFWGHEGPNPVPEDPTQDFGYPITLQLGLTSRENPAPEITLRLLEGSTEIPCWFSSPSKPTNPQLVPHNAWCLLPKGPLKKGASYTVEADWYQPAKKMTWTFKTGS